MHLSALPTALRSAAFGTHTSYKTVLGPPSARLKFGILRLFKTERDARELGSLHFAHWVVLPRSRVAALTRTRLPRAAPAVRRGQLLFLSDFSGDWEDYLAGFNVVLLAALDLVWGDATGWKRKMALGEYLAYVRRHQLQALVYYQAYGDRATVHDVRCALHVSEQLERFALATDQAHDPQRFEHAFRHLIAELGGSLAT